MKYRRFRGATGAGLLLLLGALAEPASAQTVGTLASTWQTQLTQIAPVVKSFFILVGLGLAGWSTWQWYNANKRQQPAGMYIMGVVVGIMLVGITTVLMVGSNSVLGAPDTGLTALGVGP